MAITTYAELQTAIGNWLNRQDLTSRIPEFIALFEADANRSLRVRDMVVRATASISTQYTALPTDCLELQNIQINAGTNNSIPYRLVHATQEEIDDNRTHASAVTGKPQRFTIVGLYFEAEPTPDATYECEIAYLQQMNALATQTNWLLTKHPDLYLYGSLLHAAPYLRDDDRVPLWEAACQKITGQIKEEDDRAKFNGAPLKARMRTIG